MPPRSQHRRDGDSYVTRSEFNRAMDYVKESHDALTSRVDGIPSEVADTLDERRRSNRRKMLGNVRKLVTGVVFFIAALVGILAWLGVRP